MKEPSEVVKDVNLAKLLYEKSCKIVNIDKEKFVMDKEISDGPVNNSKENEN